MISWENPWYASSGFFARLRTLPLYLIWSVAGFASGWVQTRRLWCLVLGVPALALMFLVTSSTLRSREGLTSETIRRYIAASKQHLKNNRIEQAEFYMNRMNSLGYQNDALLATRAEIATRRERPDLAERFIREMLENSDLSQDAMAHHQLAVIDLKSTSDPKSGRADDAIQHLELALQANPGDLSCHEMLSKILLARGDLNAASLHMEPVAQAYSALQIELARVYEKLGRDTLKSRAALKAESHFATVISDLESAPLKVNESAAERLQLRIAGYLNWSESLVLQGKLDEALKLLSAALDRCDSPELRNRLAEVYLRKINELSMSDESWQKRWELISLCRNYAPDMKESLIVLANIAAHAPFELRQLAQREIQPYLDNGQAPGIAYFLVGTAESQNKNWDTAQKLLRKAVEIEPHAGIAWNNLAHTLYSQPVPDWEEAERCVNVAIRMNSAPAIYHETRGQIMVGLARWAEAVQELELAAHGLPPQARIHGGLALAYTQLGDEDLAEHHRSREVALSQQ